MQAIDKPIRGKVAGILNSRELVLNRGATHGVRNGMEFSVLSTLGSDIKDPDTGEVIGSIDRTKIRVRVQIVHKQISVASTYVMQKINVGGVGPPSVGFGNLFVPPRWETVYETIETDEAMLDEMSEEERHVHIGDPIMQVMKVDE